ncbi:DNA repair protein rhp54 [Hordeum vulgare]|nr:DNA repair protein rhp54 [Hordeum vulgare]
MDDDLDAAPGLASLASSGMTTAPSDKGKPRAPRKTVAAPKLEKTLTPEQRTRDLAKRKGRMHAVDARGEAIAAVAVAAAAQQEVTNAHVTTATREGLSMLGLDPSQHDRVNAAVAAASIGSSAFPRMVLPDSPRASACTPMPGFHVYPQASCLSRETSPEVSMVAPSTPVPAPIDLNATPVAGGSSSRGERKRVRKMPADVLPGARNLFDGMPAAGNEDYMQNLIFEGGGPAAGYDPDEAQSQGGRGAFTPSTFDQDQAAFMPRERHRHERHVLKAFKVQHNGKCFNLSHCFRVIKDEEKFKAQYVALKSRGGKKVVEEVGDGEKARPRGRPTPRRRTSEM